MPLLKYVCEDCKNVFEELTRAENKPACPKCKSLKTSRYYQGKCYFGGAGHGGDSCGGGDCSTCKGCKS